MVAKGAAVRIFAIENWVLMPMVIFGSGTQQAPERLGRLKTVLMLMALRGPDTFAAMGLFQLVLLRRGSKGDAVKQLQAALDLDADGKFGSGTEKGCEELAD